MENNQAFDNHWYSEEYAKEHLYDGSNYNKQYYTIIEIIIHLGTEVRTADSVELEKNYLTYELKTPKIWIDWCSLVKHHQL